jgi:hypothetical protein
MPAPWITFLDELKDEAGSLAKEELKGLVTSALGDSDDFVRKQAIKTERYLNQLATGEITKKQFEGYMKDIEDLTRMQALKLVVEVKARAQRLADGIQNLILDKMLKLLP